MKKTLLYLILAAGLVGCAKEMVPASEENQTGKPMTFEINVLQTKAEKSAWADGDVIYVFFKDLGEKYLKLTYSHGGWNESFPAGELLDTDFAALEDKTLTAVHLPVPVNVVYEEDYQFSFYDSGGWKPQTFYLSESDKDYTVEGTTVTASLSLSKPYGVVLFHIAGLTENVGDYSFSCPLVASFACSGVTTDGSVVEEEFEADSYLPGFADADGAIYTGRLLSTSPEDYTFTLHGPAETYTLSRSNRALAAGKMYNFPALDSADWTVTGGYEYVDLGLPSGALWATMNVGASSPEDYGDYFAWGEIEPKELYAWSTLRYWDPNSGTPTKYTGSDYTYLQPDDDVATVRWGGSWHMPTDADWQELIDNCFVLWTDSYEESGVKGYVFVSQADFSKSIFLPANGIKNNEGLQAEGDRGYYWSLSLDGSVPGTAYLMYFIAGNGPSNQFVSKSGRFAGCAVRPIRGGIVPGTTGTIDGHPFVDMGNGVKWATMNVGANVPEDYGFYFAWGETLPKPSYAWGTYSLATIPEDETDPDENGWRYINKYTSDDGSYSFDGPSSPWAAAWYRMEVESYEDYQNVLIDYIGDDCMSLDDSDDAARSIWGSSWRTPSNEDFAWLQANCSYEYLEKYNGSRVNGYLFTSKINGNKLFFPSAGCYQSNGQVDANSSGSYWTNEMNFFDPKTREALLFSFGSSSVGLGFADRYKGLSIRPVSD